ncbi:MAG TPA: sulfatase [Planctomycetota bacterium]
MSSLPARARRIALLLALGLAACAPDEPGEAAVPAAAPAPEAAPPVQRDILLLLVDTLRADHLGLYGYPRATSRNLDAFAEDALVFEQVLAPAPWTLPSVGSVMTGVHPSVHGLRAHEGEGMTGLRPALATLAESLRAAGYRTAAVVTNPWLKGKTHGLQRGFDEYRVVTGMTAHEVHDEATPIVRAKDPRPLFLYLHYMGPHGPYRRHPQLGHDVLGPLPERYDRVLGEAELAALPRYLKLDGARELGAYVDRYDGAIHAWDEAFGAWMERFARRAPEAQPIVCVIADHGEEFVEHGGWNHGETLYAEQLEVPWILRLPGRPPGRIREPVSLIDVAPTLLAAVGVPIPATMTGLDVLGRPLDAGRPLFAENDVRMGGASDPAHRQSSVRIGARERIEHPGGAECYDLALDPRQAHPGCDDAAWNEALAAELRAWSEASARLAESLGSAPAVELEPGAREELRALGYAGDDE